MTNDFQKKKLIYIRAIGGCFFSRRELIHAFCVGNKLSIQSPKQLLQAAEDDWNDAREMVIEGYALGKYGLGNNPDKILELSKRGWRCADAYVIEGCALGKYGFKKNTDIVLEYAEAGIGMARQYVVEGCTEGKYGFKKDLMRLSDFLKKNWLEAKIQIKLLKCLLDNKPIREKMSF